jgi:hypothetical protein
MPLLDPTKSFTFRVLLSDEDSEFVGLCAEFPSLSWRAAPREAALTEIVKVVRKAPEDIEAAGEAPRA